MAVKPAVEAATGKTVRISGCTASALAAKYADVDVVTAYPIRPYTAIMMTLAQMIANGELDAEYIHADGEHAQLSAALGAGSAGARPGAGVPTAVQAAVRAGPPATGLARGADHARAGPAPAAQPGPGHGGGGTRHAGGDRPLREGVRPALPPLHRGISAGGR